LSDFELFLAANAEPIRPPATISEDAMARANRAAVVLLVNITNHDNTLRF
jgi:hypothetical protein